MKNNNAIRRSSQAGVSLVELMVGLTIGLVVMAGAMVILFSNQKLILEKDVMDRAQENIRFASTTITRIVRQSISFGVPSNNDELIVYFDRSQRDCLGRINNSSINTFKVNSNDELLCILDSDDTKSYVLAKGVGAVKFAYGLQSGTSATSLNYHPYFSGVSNTAYNPLVTAWNTVTSVQTQISVKDHSAKQPTIDFIATSHLLALTKLASSGGTSHAVPSEGTPPTTIPPTGNGNDPTNGSGGSENGGETPDNGGATECSSNMLADISLRSDKHSNTNSWSNFVAGEEATVTVVVKVGTDIAGWQIAKDNGKETPLQITPQLSFKLPAPIKNGNGNGNGNGKGKGNVSNSAIETMTLTLKCGTTVNSSITISSN